MLITAICTNFEVLYRYSIMCIYRKILIKKNFANRRYFLSSEEGWARKDYFFVNSSSFSNKKPIYQRIDNKANKIPRYWPKKNAIKSKYNTTDFISFFLCFLVLFIRRLKCLSAHVAFRNHSDSTATWRFWLCARSGRLLGGGKMRLCRAHSRRVASRGAMPPDFFLAPPRYFFGRKKLVFLGGKNVKICDIRQKKPSDFGEDLSFFFGDHLLLVGKFVISARKSLRISAKTFAPRSREAGDAPGTQQAKKKSKTRK